MPSKEKYRRKLEALRKRALLYALVDSGARLSEILRLNSDDVGGARLNRQGIWAVGVRGKGRGRYGRQVTLRFTRSALSIMWEWLKARADPGATALVVSRAQTRPESRAHPLPLNAAWRIVQAAAVSQRLSQIHAHGSRHWRATQMLVRV